MTKKRRWRVRDHERRRVCPSCGAAGETRVVWTFANLVRAGADELIGVVIAALLLVLTFDGGGEFGEIVPVRRRCGRCGAVFAKGRVVARRLDECVRCGYSLIGNVSGRCPECGWKLRRAHRRFARKSHHRAEGDRRGSPKEDTEDTEDTEK